MKLRQMGQIVLKGTNRTKELKVVQRKLSRWKRFNRAIHSETARTWSHRTPALMVAGVALYVSYWHIRGGALDHGLDAVSAAILPLSVDGMVITSARYVTKAQTILGKTLAIIGFILGVLATLAGNLMSSDGTPVGTGFAAWPAIAVVVTGAILHWGDAKAKPKKSTKAPTKAPSKPAQPSTPATPTATTPNGSHAAQDLSTPFVPQAA